jgi:hypothetical protein
MSGTRHIAVGYLKRSTEPDFNRHPEKNRPLLIGLGKLVAPRPSRSNKQIWEPAMPLRRESTRALERLRLATPICDDASLVKLEQDVAEYLHEAKRRDALQADEVFSTVVDAVARSYFRHILRKQARVTPVRRRARA